MVGLRNPGTAQAGARSDLVGMIFSFLFRIVSSEMCFLGIGLPIFTVCERENY